MNKLEMTGVFADLRENLRLKGFSVHATNDFGVAQRLSNEIGRVQSPQFHLAERAFSTAEAFWLFLIDPEGKAVGGSAAQLIDLGDERLDAYILRTARVYFKGNSNPIEYVASSVGDEIAGRLIYLGELEIVKEYQGKPDVLTSFVRLIKALSAIEWSDFDWMFCYVPEGYSKLMYRYEFTSITPRVIKWTQPAPQGRSDSDCLLCISHKKYDEVLRSKD